MVMKYLRSLVALSTMHLRVLLYFWPYYLMSSLLTPLLVVLMLYYVLGYTANVLYLICAMFTLSSLGTFTMISQDISSLKQTQVYEFYASLPISPLDYVLSKLIANLVMYIPSIAVLLLTGYLLTGTLPNIPLFAIAVVISYTAFIWLGMIVGLYSRNPVQANVISMIVYLVLLFGSPMYGPISNTNLVLRTAALVLPTTHIAKVFRSSYCIESVSPDTITYLAIWYIVNTVIISRRLRWTLE